MRLGIIARSDNSGLGNQSRALVEMLNPDKVLLINFEEYNKKNMSIVLPDLKPTNDNYTAYVPMAMGCQMCAMNFQNLDDNLIAYNAQFEEKKSAFILRPDNLRYKPKYIFL